MLYTNGYKTPGLIGVIDFEKELLYTNIFSCTTNNGYLSKCFPLCSVSTGTNPVTDPTTLGSVAKVVGP